VQLAIGNRHIVTVADFAAASAIYSAARERSGEGCSTFPEGTLLDGNEAVARVSYNGKVWPVGEWQPGDQPLFNPYA